MGAFVRGLGLGLGLMYFLDPEKGRRRRALLRDKLLRALDRQRSLLEAGLRDLSHRVVGICEEARARLSGRPDERVLAERVRAQLGRWVSHPRAIQVRAERGRVTLSGPILSREAEPLLRKARRVRGVRGVEDALERHARSAGVSALQGEGRVPRPFWRRDAWPPALRLVALASGTWLGARCLARGGWPGRLGALGSGALLMRAATNLPARRLLGVTASRRAVDLRKSIYIEAPLEQVYGFLTQLENLPRFMEHVRHVRVSERDPLRSHWKVDGPAGTEVGFDAEITLEEPNEALAWRTLPDQVVDHAGRIDFVREGSGTRLHVRMSYCPPGGALGHALLELFHQDPRSRMDDDFVRLKSLLEQGKTHAHGTRVRLDDLQR